MTKLEELKALRQYLALYRKYAWQAKSIGMEPCADDIQKIAKYEALIAEFEQQNPDVKDTTPMWAYAL